MLKGLVMFVSFVGIVATFKSDEVGAKSPVLGPPLIAAKSIAW